MRLCAVTCAPRTRGGLWTGVCTGGKSDGGVTATLKQGRRGSAADTAILRGCITLVQSLQHHPGTVEAEKRPRLAQSPRKKGRTIWWKVSVIQLAVLVRIKKHE